MMVEKGGINYLGRKFYILVVYWRRVFTEANERNEGGGRCRNECGTAMCFFVD
jgi:hypothetical protein